MSAVLDDLEGSQARCQAAEVGQVLFGHDDLDIVFGVVPDGIRAEYVLLRTEVFEIRRYACRFFRPDFPDV